MAGRGAAPKPVDQRINNHAARRGEWQNATGIGWQHGDAPEAPDGLMSATAEAWKVWMGAWYASFWTPEDLPALRQLARIYDQVERDPSNASLHTQLRQTMDTWGITPKGQQDRRWAPPLEEGESAGHPAKRSGTKRDRRDLKVV